MKRTHVIRGVVIALSLAWSSAAYAFTDLKDDPAEAKINALQHAGIVSGYSNDLFAPIESATLAQSIQLNVKSLGLNIDNLRFIKEPKASDYFSRVQDDAWYAQAFIIAQYNGLPIAQDADPNASITRAQFASLLDHALDRTGDYPAPLIYTEIADGSEMPEDQMNSLQRLISLKIIALEPGGKFRPLSPVTRSEAADWAYEAMELVRRHTDPAPVIERLAAKLTVEKVNEDINKVTLTQELPNPGYWLSIDRIEFTAGQKALILYTVHKPDPDKMYAQVITEAKAVTYFSSSVQPELKLSAESK